MCAESLDRNMIETTVVNTNPMVFRLLDEAKYTLTENIKGNRMGFNRQLLHAIAAIASPLSYSSTRDVRRPSLQLRRRLHCYA